MAEAALRGAPLDPRAWRAPGGDETPGRAASDVFELALCGELLEAADAATAAAPLGEGWRQWLRTNHAAGSTQV